MPKHTPGPWKVEVDSKGDVGVFAPDYGLICYPVEDNYQANARLIAAAPELRARIEARVAVCCGLTGGTACTFCMEDRALLARIDGEETTASR